MTLLRVSPSGPRLTFSHGGDVTSVFARTGKVVAEFGDYSDNSITNDSVVSGSQLAEACDALFRTSGIGNQSSIPGSSVSDALDALLPLSLATRGCIRDSFMGGRRTSTDPLTDGSIGDRRWNFGKFVSAIGGSIIKRPGESGAVGIYRIESPLGAGAGASIYLGALAAPPFEAQSWSELTWRCRFDNAQASNEVCQVGVNQSFDSVLTGGNGAAGIIGKQLGTGSSANYQSVTGASGSSVSKNTGVPIDALFHDFLIRRMSDQVIQFFIDGVLVSTHDSGVDPLPPASMKLTPIAGAVSGAGGGPTTFIDVDDYSFRSS